MAKRSHPSCIYRINYHLVLVTKYRNKCFNAEMLSFLKNTFNRLLSNQDCSLLEFNGEQDHVHLLLEVHPSIEPAKLINSLKTTSSRLIKKDYGALLKKHYWGTNAIWSRSYCLLSVGGAPLSVLKEYIENQNTPKE